jgi:hypothetical protein
MLPLPSRFLLRLRLRSSPFRLAPIAAANRARHDRDQFLPQLKRFSEL